MNYKYQCEFEIYEEAQKAAADATQKHIEKNSGTWYPCGFAWVKIKPSRGRFVQMCKDKKLGNTDDYQGGFLIYNPSGNSTQWMDAKEIGAYAFCEVLKKYYPDANIYVRTRID